jgi:recombination protein RecA
MAPPFKKVELDMFFGEGLSYHGSILDAALKYEMLDKSGSWYSYNDEKIGQGRENAINFLKTNTDITVDLEKRLRSVMFPAPVDSQQAETAKE